MKLLAPVSEIFVKQFSSLGNCFVFFAIAFTFIKHSESQNQVSCDKFTVFSWYIEPKSLSLTCHINNLAITSNDYSFSYQRNESIGAVDMNGNRKIHFLPVNPANSFPSLKAYCAERCSVKIIYKENFKGLLQLKRIQLQGNQIQKIDDDTFEDLLQLEILVLCKIESFQLQGFL